MNAMPYWTTTTQIRESWAIVVEWRLTHLEYAERGINNYGEFNYHPSPIYHNFPMTTHINNWNSGIRANYTPLFIDLADGHNQIGINYGFYTGIVNDNVSGYNLPLVEINILPYIHNLSTLANRLKLNKPAGVTDAQIDELLSFY